MAGRLEYHIQKIIAISSVPNMVTDRFYLKSCWQLLSLYELTFFLSLSLNKNVEYQFYLGKSSVEANMTS